MAVLRRSKLIDKNAQATHADVVLAAGHPLRPKVCRDKPCHDTEIAVQATSAVRRSSLFSSQSWRATPR